VDSYPITHKLSSVRDVVIGHVTWTDNENESHLLIIERRIPVTMIYY